MKKKVQHCASFLLDEHVCIWLTFSRFPGWPLDGIVWFDKVSFSNKVIPQIPLEHSLEAVKFTEIKDILPHFE